MFNKVRLIRTTSNEFLTSHGNWFHVAELQIWVGGTNIALAGTTGSSGDYDDGSVWSKDNINNNNLSGSGASDTWHSHTEDIGNYVEIILPNNENIENLQSILVYQYLNLGLFPRMLGVSVQLMYDDNIIYSEEINTANMVYRVDGPAFSSVTGSMMSMEPSTTLIYNGHEVIDASTVTNGNINTTFSKVRVIRTGESGFNNSTEGWS